MAVSRPLFWKENYANGAQHLAPLLQLTIPGIDPNDFMKTQATLQFYYFLLYSVPIVNCSGRAPDNATEEEQAILDSTAVFEDWVMQFMDRVFLMLETQVEVTSKRHTVEKGLADLLFAACYALFQQLSPSLFETTLQKLFRWVTTNLLLTSAKTVGGICASATRANAALTFRVFLPHLSSRITSLVAQHATDNDPDADDNEIDDELQWYLSIITRLVKRSGPELLKVREMIMDLLQGTLHLASKKASKLGGKLLRQTLKALMDIYPTDGHILTRKQREALADDPVAQFNLRGSTPGPYEGLDVEWHVPSQEEVDFAEELVSTFYDPAVESIEALLAQAEPDTGLTAKMSLRNNLMIIRNVMRVGASLTPEIDSPVLNVRETKVPMERAQLKTTAGDAKLAPAAFARRERLCVVTHKLTTFLLSEREDDTKSLKLLVKIMYQILCVR